MSNPAGARESVWTATAELLDRPPLAGTTTADVCVVGAGIAGLSTAYLLACEGRSVIVLDDGPVGGGMTCRTTAHLTNAIDDRFHAIERLHGGKGLRLAAESHTRAIDRIESNVIAEGIACDFERVDGYLFLPEGGDLEDLDKDLEGARAAGIAGVERIARAPIASFDTGPCNRFPRQAQLHPVRYLNGLAEAFERRGGRIACSTHATSMTGGREARVETANGSSVSCAAVIVATNTPVNDRVVIHSKQAPYTTFVVGMSVPAGSVPRVLLWDLADPYHYVRVVPGVGADHEILLVGGEDVKSGHDREPSGRHDALVAWTRERFPMAGAVEFAWAGQVMEPVDGVAYIGRNPMDDDNVFVVTGDSGQGMTHGTIASMLLTDLVLGRENAWETLYDPARKPHHGPVQYLKENLDVVRKAVGDRFRAGDVGSREEIAAGCGALLRDGAHLVAAYRDEAGTLHERSATCPHLGCVVAWNGVEKTWDCPCHGSRFDCRGHVINGPANRDLSPAPGR